jgi:hypothetical protein
MRGKYLTFVLALAMLLVGAPGVTVASVYKASAARSLFERAISRVEHLSRLEVKGKSEQVLAVKKGPSVIARPYDLRFIAPNRLSILQASVYRVQVGTKACLRVEIAARSSHWICGHTTTPPSVVGELGNAFWPSPALAHAAFQSRSGITTIGKKRYRVTIIMITSSYKRYSSKATISYSGVLAVNPKSDLPFTFVGTFSVNHHTYLRWHVSFSYGGHFTIQLPHVKSSSPAPGPPPKP